MVKLSDYTGTPIEKSFQKDDNENINKAWSPQARAAAAQARKFHKKMRELKEGSEEHKAAKQSMMTHLDKMPATYKAEFLFKNNIKKD